MAREYVVTIPVVGLISYTVEVPDDVGSEKDAHKAAIELAWDEYDDDEDHRSVEWNAVESICTGNVCRAPVNEITEMKSRPRETNKKWLTIWPTFSSWNRQSWLHFTTDSGTI